MIIVHWHLYLAAYLMRMLSFLLEQLEPQKCYRRKGVKKKKQTVHFTPRGDNAQYVQLGFRVGTSSSSQNVQSPDIRSP